MVSVLTALGGSSSSTCASGFGVCCYCKFIKIIFCKFAFRANARVLTLGLSSETEVYCLKNGCLSRVTNKKYLFSCAKALNYNIALPLYWSFEENVKKKSEIKLFPSQCSCLFPKAVLV